MKQAFKNVAYFLHNIQIQYKQDRLITYFTICVTEWTRDNDHVQESDIVAVIDKIVPKTEFKNNRAIATPPPPQ